MKLAEPYSASTSWKRCPECGVYPLAEEHEALFCPGCSRRYKVHDGIYDFKDWEIDTVG